MLSFKEYINEIKFRFSDSIENTPEVKTNNLIFNLCGKQIEFKPENEVKENGDIYFTWKEALALQKNNWRLPTKEEFKALLEKEYMFGHGKGIFDSRLILPAAGGRNCDGFVNGVGSGGYYWSSTPYSSESTWGLGFYSGGVYMYYSNRCDGQSVRLVRDVK